MLQYHAYYSWLKKTPDSLGEKDSDISILTGNQIDKGFVFVKIRFNSDCAS